MQFYKGKSYGTFGPTGPYLTLVDETIREAWRTLRLELRVNGEVRQSDLAENMVFKPGATLTEMSAMQDLHAGDLVVTGTPAGVAMQLPPAWVVRLVQMIPEHRRWPMFISRQKQSGRYLNLGDLVECSIRSEDGQLDLGMLSNRVQAV